MMTGYEADETIFITPAISGTSPYSLLITDAGVI